MSTLSDLQNMFNQGGYLFSERNDDSFEAAHADLRFFMGGDHQPTWLAVVYSSASGLVFVMRGPGQPQVIRYMAPLYLESAKLVIEVAKITIPDYSQAELGRLFSNHAQVALTELGSEPKVSINPGILLPAQPGSD